jgi:hypothetical protein
MKLAASFNSPIRSLTLIDIGPFVTADSLNRIGSYLGKEATFASPDDYKVVFKKNFAQFGDLPEAQWDQMVRHSVRPTHVDGKDCYRVHYDQEINWAFQQVRSVASGKLVVI